jgi:hypothetical protein
MPVEPIGPAASPSVAILAHESRSSAQATHVWVTPPLGVPIWTSCESTTSTAQRCDLLIETGDGLVLVDSGIGMADVTNPPGTLTTPFQQATRPVFDERKPPYAR